MNQENVLNLVNQKPVTPNQPTVLTSKNYRRQINNNKTMLDDFKSRFGVPAMLPAINPAEPQVAPPSGGLTPEETQKLTGGDLSGLKFNQFDTTFMPAEGGHITPEMMQKHKNVMMRDNHYQQVSQELNNLALRATSANKAVFGLMQELLAKRVKILKTIDGV